MPLTPGGVFDTKMRHILERLAEGLFPLSKWLEERDKEGRHYDPPERDLPWRSKNGYSLTPKDLGAIDFFLQRLVVESRADAELLKRWNEVAADPLRYSPLEDVRDWRAARNMDKEPPRFGIVESGNVLIDAAKNPVLRSAFYASYWPLLATTFAAIDPQTLEERIAFAESLWTDTCVAWPNGQPLRSSVFIKQFSRDLLYAMMNMQNPVGSPWREALLIELGERRRVGNRYTAADAEEAVIKFAERLGSGKEWAHGDR